MRLALSIVVASCLVGAALPGCGGSQSGPALSYGESARRDYERALGAFQDNDCLTAVPLLQNVRREYPYSRYAALAELRLADCELQQQHYTEAIRGYRAFVRQRPTHPEVDTASFAIAQAYFRQIPQDFFLSPPPEERDQAATRNALRIVRRFLLEFPESDHLEEARTLERAVLSLLARHDLYVASYYLARDRPAATIMRIDALIEQYEGSGVEPEAMLLRGRTYLHMREQRQARLAFGELIRRYPESGFAVQARSYLRAMGVDPEDAVAEGEDGGDGDRRLPPAPPPDDDGDLGGIAPGTDIDDVTDVTDETQRRIDTAEDASESGLEVTEEGDVEAGEIEDEDLHDPEE